MARNPDRIEPLISLLEQEWKENPDIRLGQLVAKLAQDDDPFYVEDTAIAKRLCFAQNEPYLFEEMEYWIDDPDREPKPCGEYHPLPCGLDRDCEVPSEWFEAGVESNEVWEAYTNANAADGDNA